MAGKRKETLINFLCPQVHFTYPFIFCEWLYWKAEWLGSVKPAMGFYLKSVIISWALSLLASWERGSQVLENSVGTTLSFLRQHEKVFREHPVLRSTLKLMALQADIPRAPFHLVQNLWKPQPARHSHLYPHWPQQQNNLWFSNLRGLFWHSSSFF